jgi:DNA polymerase-3 subunit delta'
MKKLEHGNVTLIYPIPAVGQVKDEDPVTKLSGDVLEDLQNQIQEKAKNPYKKITLEKANVIPISMIRNLKRNIYLTAPEKGWKVVIVFDADMMNTESANSFLKILEEPPQKTTIIMTTSRIGRILPTIKSRCKSLYFNKLHTEDIREYLKAGNFTGEQVQLMVNLADGNMTSLMKLMNQDVKHIKDMTLDIIRAIAGWNIKKIRTVITTLASTQKSDSTLFIQILTSINFWFRDAEILRQQLPDKELIHFEQEETLQKFVNGYPDFNSYEINHVIDNCIDFISRNVYINVALMDMFFKIRKLIGKKK